MKESVYQAKLIKKIEKQFPGCIVLKNDPQHIQGIPDLLILFKNTWAALETKRKQNSSKQMNQPFYVDLLNKMSYAAFVSPENEAEVLDELRRALVRS